jgi:hypothetical protein
MTLNFEPDMHERFGSLRECIAQGVYQRGLTNVAPSLNKAPGNLSVELSEDTSRKFSVDSLEDYIEKFNDHQPIYYLVSKFLDKKEPAEPDLPPELIAAFVKMAPMLKRKGLL